MECKESLRQACLQRGCVRAGGTACRCVRARVSARLPLWLASILEKAGKMKCDKSRRRAAYKLIYSKLFNAGIGLQKTAYPTYVYPEELKSFIRSFFSNGVCDYPDPNNNKVVYVTREELFLLENRKL